MPVLPLESHLPTQYTTHTITLQQWTNNKTNKSQKQLIYIYICHVNVTQTVPDISPLMPMHQDPLLVSALLKQTFRNWPSSMGFVRLYSIHVPGWLLKWLNLITAHSSVSNEPGSGTWLATKYLKTVSWRNHTEELTTLWRQNISFWPKISIPSSYFTILMLNCLESTLKLQFDSYVTAVKFLT